MADNKKGFMLYADLIHTLEKMPDEKAGQLFKVILDYVNDRSPEIDDLMIDLVFEPIKQQLKRDLKKWEARADKSRENGKKGGRPKKPKETHQVLDETKETQQVILKPTKPVNVNVNVTDIHREILPAEIIGLYRMRVSDKQQKVKEVKTISEIALNKSHDKQKILSGIQNYSETIKELDEQYITNLLDFVKDKIYLDYQETKKVKVELDMNGNPLVGNFQ